MADVTIGSGVSQIWSNAFRDCTGLISITIGENVIYIGLGVFLNCSSLKAIMVDTANPAYSSLDGVLFIKDQTGLKQYPPAKVGGYTIPDGVEHIYDAAFGLCTNLTCIIIPDSLIQTVGTPFFGCSSLSGVYFKGDAPAMVSLYGADNATVYYIPGTTGWGGDL